MQLNMQDIYDNSGSISKQATPWLSGHKQRLTLLPNLHLLNQHLSSNADVSIHEEAPAGLYFSFLGTGPIKTVEDIQSVQINYQARAISGDILIKKGEEFSLLQAHISPSLLASVLGETEDQVIQHFVSMRNKLGNEKSVIQLPVTDNTRPALTNILNHKSHSISLAGHLYSLIFTLIEQLQMLSHLSQCEGCQSKLFSAQNLLETPDLNKLDLQNLAHTVGLNTEALAIGFKYLTGKSIESYFTLNRIESAALKLRENPAEKSHIVAQSGFSEAQFEAAFIKYFGVYSHQYGQIH
ncbi:MAG: helix-turn-helix domain-containing protein [Marinomonas foliarum]|uniref:AraC family transcriptional regulator n=1 Tax=Marinomonas foliarum TaxID=491950 RepID=A0A368ZRE2_9GAMM|nr:AraC family transcriptional regulator [Marinomonas foliarum]QRV23549.1 AraC family transcriptional regulator [Marinomonas foliarum]RCW98545.1 hypothetical protein DFP77_12714 [Marinomonas foliarum]